MMSDEALVKKIETKYGIFNCLKGDLISEHLEQYSAHTRNELAMVLDHIAYDDIVFDIGSHIGTFTIPIAKKLAEGKGHVYAFEPNKLSFDLFKKNIAENGLTEFVTATNALVTDNVNITYSGEMDESNTGSNFYTEQIESGIRMTAINLRDYIVSNNISKIDFIKIDVEGMEYKVLTSIVDLISHFRPTLYIEISVSQLDRHAHTPDDIEKLLTALDYSFYRNKYLRNSCEDVYEKSIINTLGGQPLFDLLAIPN